MNNLKFKYMAAWNFLCFGPDGIELDLESMGNIVVVKGENWHDVNPITGRPGSNGSGKSACPNILTYALFGRIVNDGVPVEKLIHKGLKKKLKVEVIWDRYRVVRTRKPDSLRLWESGAGTWEDSTEITCGAGVAETQKKIEAILGMSYKSFVGLTVFDDRSDHSFMEMSGPDKRMLIENQLSLEKYREYSKVARSLKIEADRLVKQHAESYQRAVTDAEYSRVRVSQMSTQREAWRRSQQIKVDALLDSISRERGKMADTDHGAAVAAYESAQARLAAIDAESASSAESRARVAAMAEDAKIRRDELRRQASVATIERDRQLSLSQELMGRQSELRRQIESLDSLKPGVTCDRCLGEIDPANFDHVVQKYRQTIAELDEGLEAIRLSQGLAESAMAGLAPQITKLSEMVDMASRKDAEIGKRIAGLNAESDRLPRMSRPSADGAIALMEQRIEDLKSQSAAIGAELAGPSPYDSMLIDADAEVEQREEVADRRRSEASDAESRLPYHKFWVEAFGDGGIRKFVIDGIIPTLNSQIAYWLDILIYGNLRLRFDNTLEPTIERVPFDDDPFVYSVMSGGERRRMNLSVILAFAHIQMLNCGACPSLLFLDEVVTNIDANGKQAAFDMIQELAATRQVFLTTHDTELLELLQGCQVLRLERRDGTTKVAA